MSKHERFIKSPIKSLIEDAISASSASGDGMETYQLSEYILQSLFLKMTGYSEQKLKCILWDIATDDYEFRYKLLSGQERIGECSTYADKNTVFKLLVNHVTISKSNIDGFKRDLIFELGEDLRELFSGSVLRTWIPREYNSFLFFCESKREDLLNTFFIKDGNDYVLFKKHSDLFNAYQHLYRHRNRCAHNLRSYQENLPSIKYLSGNDYGICENYFLWFFLLMLLDRVFIYLYSEYSNTSTFW